MVREGVVIGEEDHKVGDALALLGVFQRAGRLGLIHDTGRSVIEWGRHGNTFEGLNYSRG